jgi:hypothetical protein
MLGEYTPLLKSQQQPLKMETLSFPLSPSIMEKKKTNTQSMLADSSLPLLPRRVYNDR